MKEQSLTLQPLSCGRGEIIASFLPDFINKITSVAMRNMRW
jgi:hypothetical protein